MKQGNDFVEKRFYSQDQEPWRQVAVWHAFGFGGRLQRQGIAP